MINGTVSTRLNRVPLICARRQALSRLGFAQSTERMTIDGSASTAATFQTVMSIERNAGGPGVRLHAERRPQGRVLGPRGLPAKTQAGGRGTGRRAGQLRLPGGEERDSGGNARRDPDQRSRWGGLSSYQGGLRCCEGDRWVLLDPGPLGDVASRQFLDHKVMEKAVALGIVVKVRKAVQR